VLTKTKNTSHKTTMPMTLSQCLSMVLPALSGRC